MDLKTQKKMASDVLGVGENRVWIDPGRQDEIEGAITKEDIRSLIESGAIQKKDKEGNSRGRAREKDEQKKKGRHKGHGSRKGSKKSRKKDKDEWKEKIRALRERLKEMRDSGELDPGSYRKLYDMAKGGFFRSKKHMEIYIDKNIDTEE
ncbi:MAG: 50S ribosomal protein L19e [Candidatus Nanohaloarchaea archaeon]|nr:50S ribosomal protein L19e [Candidatus Nanohaloarchaea archaeon]